MCGLTGYLGRADEGTREVVARMAERLAHRGPDAAGTWSEADGTAGLGHQRLSVIDLSAAGAQPMVSASGRYAVAMNGEIYNFRTLRREFEREGATFRGHSDTEVAVAAIERRGVIEALRGFVGMFAFAIWDREARCMWLARDRLGEKPLYYGHVSDGVVFGSELKALRAHPRWRPEVDRDALAMLLKYTYIPAPYCIYRGCAKVEPGTALSLRFAGDTAHVERHVYWDAGQVTLDGIRQRNAARSTDDELALTGELDTLLRRTIEDQMIADVPLGAFLSGGIDSSTVTALMQQLSSRPVRTFSIGFEEREYDEAPHARAVAEHLGTQHTELYVTPAQALDVIPQLPALYDEPFSDSSQIPTYLIAKMAREHVTVALTGDGGDELFGGYNRYLIARDVWRTIERVPRPLRRAAGSALRLLPPSVYNRAMALARPAVPGRWRYRQVGEKLHKLGEVWSASSPDILYDRLISLYEEPTRVVRGASLPDPLERHAGTLAGMDDFTDRMMFSDLVTYLPDDILVKVDRASMGVSLETRVPFLDHRVAEFCWTLPLHLKIRNGTGKWLLREVLSRYVPRALFERPKMGFGVPIDHWLRGPLKDWGEALLAEQRLREEGYFDAGVVRRVWDAHQRGESAEHYRLWPVLMFQAWLDEQR